MSTPNKYAYCIFSTLIILCLANNCEGQKRIPPPPPVLANFWKEASVEQKTKIVAQTNRLLKLHKWPTPEFYLARVRPLRCYQNANYYELEGKYHDTARVYSVVAIQDSFFLLTDSTSSLYAVNRTHKPELNKVGGLWDYTQLFVSCVSTDIGRYRSFGFTFEMKNLFTDITDLFFKPTNIFSFPQYLSGEKPAIVEVNMKVKHDIFRATLEVKANGEISMQKDSFIFGAPMYSERFDKGGYYASYEPASVAGKYHPVPQDAATFLKQGTDRITNAQSGDDARAGFGQVVDAAVLGSADAYRFLGDLYKEGRVVAMNNESAQYCFREAGFIDRANAPVPKSPELIADERCQAIAQRFNTYKNRIKVKSTIRPKNFETLTLFENPFLYNNEWYDAIVLEPQETGYLYWAALHEEIPGTFGWYVFEYDPAKIKTAKLERKGFFSGFVMTNEKKGLEQKTDIPLAKGKIYILWLSFGKKAEYNDTPLKLQVSFNLLKDKSTDLAKFFEGKQ